MFKISTIDMIGIGIAFFNAGAAAMFVMAVFLPFNPAHRNPCRNHRTVERSTPRWRSRGSTRGKLPSPGARVTPENPTVETDSMAGISDSNFDVRREYSSL
jgi:hypothetical protein